MASRYSPLKIFHFPEKLASLPRDVQEVLPPLHVRIKPTNACPHKCRYCSYRAPDLQLGAGMKPSQSIPREKMIEIIDDLAGMGVQAVTFSGGGEPFCYPHLEEAAAKLAQSPVRFAALTNGARVEGSVAELFAKKAAWLRVSIDGWDAASYARYRGVSEDEFGRVIGNMERFKAIDGPCRLGISLIVDCENAPHVFETIALARKVGADSVKVSPCVVSDCGGENSLYHEPYYEAVGQQVAEAREAFEDDTFEIYNAYVPHQSDYGKAYTWCPYEQILSIIGADLGVYTCQDKAYNHDSGLLGSIEHVSFREFWLDGKEKFFRVNPGRDCTHHCVADAKNRLVLDYLGLDPGHLGFV